LHLHYLLNTSDSLNTHLLSMGLSMHLSNVSKRKVNDYILLTLASNYPGFSKIKREIDTQWIQWLLRTFDSAHLNLEKKKTVTHCFTLQLVHIFEIFVHEKSEKIFCTYLLNKYQSFVHTLWVGIKEKSFFL